jgi:hypothetical protein
MGLLSQWEALINTTLYPIGLELSRISCSGMRDNVMCMQVLSNIKHQGGQ